jgi:hypothetical protein
MASFASPYGLKPINLIGGQAFNGGVIREIPLTASTNLPIYNGDLVKIVGGVAQVVNATPTTSTTGVLGVFVGCRYQLASQQLGYPLFAQYLPANAIAAGFTNVFVRVMDDPDALFQVQATGSVNASSIGFNAQLSGYGNGTNSTTGNVSTGNSIISLLQTSISNASANASYAVRIVDLVNDSSTFGGNYPSNPGDAYTDCIVKLNFGVHSYYNGTPS